MDPVLREVLDLFIRWIHLIAGIMWIGNSMLFNWLDRNLVKAEGARARSLGEIWLLHSGAFYQVEKMTLAPNEMPKVLHWFKWQAYTTWMSGFLLMGLVYYLGGKSFLVDPQIMDIAYGTAVALSLGVLVGGFAVYDLLWRFLAHKSGLATVLSLACVAAFVVGIHQVFTPRAAYLHVGALLGSVMAGNVFFHIIPSQKQMVAATLSGHQADPALSQHAKTRSIHNNYITFPVLFIMLSNHFPSTWGHTFNWGVLALLMIGGATARHFLNIRFTFQRWLPALLGTITATVVGLWMLVAPPAAVSSSASAPEASAGAAGTERVAFPVVQAVVNARCTPCHAAHPTNPQFAAAPAGGVLLDSPEKIVALADRIKYRAVVTKTMPLVNQTGITSLERELLGRWVDEGAHSN